MSTQVWRIQAPGNCYTPAEAAHVVRAAHAFGEIIAAVGAPTAFHEVLIDGLQVIPQSIVVDWPQPGDAVIQLAPCEVCGFSDWPAGGMHAARSIHMHNHKITAETMARRASSPAK